MNIWLVNLFDPLPGDMEQEGRYASLVRLLLSREHRVTWWTSSFSHRFKRPIDKKQIKTVCNKLCLQVRFLETPPYSKNVSLARLWNHWIAARWFSKQALQEELRPDIVLASAPPPFLARAAARYAKQAGAKFVVDVQDAWPETFYRLAPKPARPLLKMALLPWSWAGNEAYALADMIVGVADEYVRQAVKRGGRDTRTATVPLGVDLAVFDQAVNEGRTEKWTKPAGETWLIYSGSLNRSYDCLTIIKAFARLKDREGFKRLRLFITGQGELEAEARKIVEEENLSNVSLLGFMDFNEWAYLLSQCDIGFNASFPEAMIYLPNKIFYYLAAGLAVLNTIPGQCSKIVTDANAGKNYPAGNVEQALTEIHSLVMNPTKLRKAKEASRILSEQEYDRHILLPQYTRFLEGLSR